MNKQQREVLASRLQAKVQWDVDMSDYSTLRAGGRAAALVTVEDFEELRSILCLLKQEEIRCLVIGRGSNILVSDKGYPGVIIRLKGSLKGIRQENETLAAGKVIVKVGAGCNMAALLSWCTGQGLSGLEFMTGIPGSVGGAVRMNAGAWGAAIGELLHEVELIDFSGCSRRVSKSGLTLSYRDLALKEGAMEQMVIVRAGFVLAEDDIEEIKKRSRSYLERRQGKQPAGVASAGSFFKNPAGDSAGRLIEAAGLKGTGCGQAMVSPVHANFIVNTGGASATDIIELMQLVQQQVFRQFGVHLEPEVRIF
jgi:UDP-N-acetylmuramate dehydrogenase